MIALEEGRQTLRWSMSLGIVLAAYAAVIGAAWWWHSRQAPAPLPLVAEAVMVELAPVPEAPPTTATELPPGPPRQEQIRPEPKPKPAPVPKLELPPNVRPEVEDPYRREEAKQEEDRTAEATNVDRTSAPPRVQAPAGTRYAANQSLAGTVSQAMVTWQSQVLGHLERFKRYPRAAQRRHQEGVVQVRYAVDRQGRVLSVELVHGSGRALLDEEAIAAVTRASPLPPPPPAIEGNPVEVTTPVEFSLWRR